MNKNDQNDQNDQIDLSNQKEQKTNKNEPICVNIGEIWKRPNKIPNNFQTCRPVHLHSRSKILTLRAGFHLSLKV